MKTHLPPETYRKLNRFAGDFSDLMLALKDEHDRAERRADARPNGWRGPAADDSAWRWDLARVLEASGDMLEQTGRYLALYPQHMPTPAARKGTAKIQIRSSSLSPASFDPSDESLEVLWSTGQDVVRYDWDGSPYLERLVMVPSAVRLGRLNAGAPFLNTHSSMDLGDIIGTIVPGSARIQGGQGIARVRLSTDAAHAGVVGNIRAGIIRNVSVGYVVHQQVDTEGVNGSLPVRRITDWEPLEVSAVPIPADASAQIRSH